MGAVRVSPDEDRIGHDFPSTTNEIARVKLSIDQIVNVVSFDLSQVPWILADMFTNIAREVRPTDIAALTAWHLAHILALHSELSLLLFKLSFSVSHKSCIAADYLRFSQVSVVGLLLLYPELFHRNQLTWSKFKFRLLHSLPELRVFRLSDSREAEDLGAEHSISKVADIALTLVEGRLVNVD